MTYRCPYCRNLIEGEPQSKCPSCGRMMVVPKMREPNPRIARRRIIENIWRETERKKAELQGAIPISTFRNPKFYFGIVIVLLIIGMALSSATDKAVERQRDLTPPEMRTLRNLDVLAEALGRYRFHTGSYPTRRDGLDVLVRKPVAQNVPGWNGPYISHLCNDAWSTPFVYEPPETPDELPALFSCGPDRQPNTPDDLKPDPARFDPGTQWTNGWLRVEERLPGVTVIK